MDKNTPEHVSRSSSDRPASNSSGGGFFIAIGTIAGVFVGGFLGQPSVGLLAGLALGALAALALWWKQR